MLQTCDSWVPQQEDDSIKELVAEQGTKRWSLIADLLKSRYGIHHRTGKQLFDRYAVKDILNYRNFAVDFVRWVHIIFVSPPTRVRNRHSGDKREVVIGQTEARGYVAASIYFASHRC